MATQKMKCVQTYADPERVFVAGQVYDVDVEDVAPISMDNDGNDIFIPAEQKKSPTTRSRTKKKDEPVTK